MFTTFLINFRFDIYFGDELPAAMLAAERACFECSIMMDGIIIKTFSPILGWKAIKDFA